MKKTFCLLLSLLLGLSCFGLAEGSPATTTAETPEALVIYDDAGNEVWNVKDYSFDFNIIEP